MSMPHDKDAPREIWIVAFDKVAESLANVLDEQDTLQRFPCASETLLTLARHGCDRWTESMNGSKDRVVLKLDGPPMK